MSLKRILEIRHSLAFRLTIWYGIVFTVSSFLAFLIFYLSINTVIQNRIDNELRSELVEFSSLYALKRDISHLESELKIEAISDGVEKVFFRILTLNGKKIASSNMSSWKEIGIKKRILGELKQGITPVLETIQRPDTHDKVRILYGVIQPGIIMQIGRSMKEDSIFLDTFRDIFSTSIFFILILSVIIGWFMAKRALSGLEQVTQTALNISEGAFDERVKLKVRDSEIHQLVSTFNNMLDKIHSLITSLREITDNIAHDLKSPISRIRGMAELTLTSDSTINDYKEMSADIIEECDRLLGMINTMLDISEIEAGATKPKMEKMDICQLVQEAHELFLPIAQNKMIKMELRLNDRLYMMGDTKRLQRMMANLVDNALKYTPQGGKVDIHVSGDKHLITITVNDTGIGILKDEIPRIFDRFYRCDRSRSSPGAGLGLSLARAIARAHGGDITVKSTPGKGSSFKITLPR